MSALILGVLLGSFAASALIVLLAGSVVAWAQRHPLDLDADFDEVDDPQPSHVRRVPDSAASRIHCSLCGNRWRGDMTSAIDHLLETHPAKVRWPDGTPVDLSDIDHPPGGAA